MEITIIQALLIGLWTAFCYAGMLFGIYTNRCIVLSFGVGVILGDIPTALQCGAIGELAFMGFGVGAGGTVPPNPIGPGIIGTLMAITMSSVTPESALPISIPFAVAIQFLQTAIYTVRAGAPESAAKALAEKNFSKFPQNFKYDSYFICCCRFPTRFPRCIQHGYTQPSCRNDSSVAVKRSDRCRWYAPSYRFCYDYERYA